VAQSALNPTPEKEADSGLNCTNLREKRWWGRAHLRAVEEVGRLRSECVLGCFFEDFDFRENRFGRFGSLGQAALVEGEQNSVHFFSNRRSRFQMSWNRFCVQRNEARFLQRFSRSDVVRIATHC
jgi:hypothetical protein